MGRTERREIEIRARREGEANKNIERGGERRAEREKKEKREKREERAVGEGE